MNAGDPIDYMIRHYHADGRMRCWIARKLGISESDMRNRIVLLGISFMNHSGVPSAPCANGHNAVVVGVREGRCARCGEPVEMGRLVELDGRALSRAAALEVARASRRAARLAKRMENWRQRRGA